MLDYEPQVVHFGGHGEGNQGLVLEDAYLNEINWAFWDSPGDTDRLLEELQRAIAGEALAIDTVQKADLLATAPVSDALPRPLPAAQPVSLEMYVTQLAQQSSHHAGLKAARSGAGDFDGTLSTD